MDIKPTLFIGSSCEGLPVALLVKKHLSDMPDCQVWNEDVFDYGKSFFETLVELLSLFEYGVLIGTADDLVLSRKRKQMESRDNVLFEFGLFLGRLGREKVFFLKEAGAKTPSDLQGVSLPEFSSKDAVDLEHQIAERCARIKKQIAGRSGIFDGGIFPSIPLAYGYFHNSLLPVCQQLNRSPEIRLRGKTMDVQNFTIRVLIPDDLRHDMKEKVEFAKDRDRWVQVEVPTAATRSYNFYVEDARFDPRHLVMLDIPTTLNALNQTIEEFVGSGKVGRSVKQRLVEQREIRHFRKVVDYLAEVNPSTKSHVVTEIVDI